MVIHEKGKDEGKNRRLVLNIFYIILIFVLHECILP